MAGKLSAEQCSNAATNVQAVFEPKAPRFPTRAACERVFPFADCSLGFEGAGGWVGKRSAIYFSPRLEVFAFPLRPRRRHGHSLSRWPRGAVFLTLDHEERHRN